MPRERSFGDAQLALSVDNTSAFYNVKLWLNGFGKLRPHISIKTNEFDITLGKMKGVTCITPCRGLVDNKSN